MLDFFGPTFHTKIFFDRNFNHIDDNRGNYDQYNRNFRNFDDQKSKQNFRPSTFSDSKIYDV